MRRYNTSKVRNVPCFVLMVPYTNQKFASGVSLSQYDEEPLELDISTELLTVILKKNGFVLNAKTKVIVLNLYLRI